MPHILAVDLTGNFLDDAAVGRICDTLKERLASSEPPSICELDLSQNPITAAAAIRLIDLANAMSTLVVVGLAETSVPTAFRVRLNATCARNATREPAASLMRRLRGEKGLPSVPGAKPAAPVPSAASAETALPRL